MPEVVIIAGPNGAGKTTFANQYLPLRQRPVDFINADEIARDVPRSTALRRRTDVCAARIMLVRIDQLVAGGANFMFETTLAARTYASKIPAWRKSGYTVSLVYLRLPSIEASIARVQRRVAAGGHSIPEETIRRRFDRSLIYFENIYKSIVDEWYIWDSLEGAFVLAQSWDQA